MLHHRHRVLCPMEHLNFTTGTTIVFALAKTFIELFEAVKMVVPCKDGVTVHEHDADCCAGNHLIVEILKEHPMRISLSGIGSLHKDSERRLAEE